MLSTAESVKCQEYNQVNVTGHFICSSSQRVQNKSLKVLLNTPLTKTAPSPISKIPSLARYYFSLSPEKKNGPRKETLKRKP
jgi:hypothetical protein